MISKIQFLLLKGVLKRMSNWWFS